MGLYVHGAFIYCVVQGLLEIKTVMNYQSSFKLEQTEEPHYVPRAFPTEICFLGLKEIENNGIHAMITTINT